MCLPYNYERAQSMANMILNETPNANLLLRKDLSISEFNRRAEKIFHISRAEAIGRYIYEFMDDTFFRNILSDHQPVHRQKMDLDAYGLTVLVSGVYIDSQESLLVVLQDITNEEKELEHQYQLKIKTVEAAQQVIDKQMMVAQEIAGLLGETTAETKATLNQLKRSILEDDNKTDRR